MVVISMVGALRWSFEAEDCVTLRQVDSCYGECKYCKAQYEGCDSLISILLPKKLPSIAHNFPSTSYTTHPCTTNAAPTPCKKRKHKKILSMQACAQPDAAKCQIYIIEWLRISRYHPPRRSSGSAGSEFLLCIHTRDPRQRTDHTM